VDKDFLQATGYTLIRVLGALGFKLNLGRTHAGFGSGLSPQRIRVAQPIIQVLASFPAPMLYPLSVSHTF
jgi:ABC-type anion transport system duplicated permease subunit